MYVCVCVCVLGSSRGHTFRLFTCTRFKIIKLLFKLTVLLYQVCGTGPCLSCFVVPGVWYWALFKLFCCTRCVVLGPV